MMQTLKSNPGVEAVRELARMGYRFTINNGFIRIRHLGDNKPAADKVLSLFEKVRAHKTVVIYFLRSFCPRCGGCCFVPDHEGQPLCLACDWDDLVQMYPNLNVKH